MIRVGMHRDEVDAKEVLSAVFHPFKDIWHIVVHDVEQPIIAEFMDGICMEIYYFQTLDQAMSKMMGICQEYGKLLEPIINKHKK